MTSAATQVCPVTSSTATVLPPDHPAYDESNSEARCPITNAKVSHHHTIHNHPSAPHTASATNKPDATQCPAVQSMASAGTTVTDATCPVVGPVNSHLPPDHPAMTEADAGKVCPVTNATLEHHVGKLAQHPGVEGEMSAGLCPVAKGMVGAGGS